MKDDTLGIVLLGAAAVGVAALATKGTASGANAAPSRREVQDHWEPSRASLLERMASFRAENPTAHSETVESAAQGGFAQQVVERTGFLPSGFDAAGRVSLNQQRQESDDYQQGGGFVGL